MNYILDFKNTTTDEEISSYLSENSLTVLKTYDHFDKIFLVSGITLPPKTEILEHVVEDHSGAVSLLDNVSITELNYEENNINLSDEKNWWKIAILEKVNFDNESQVINRLGSRVSIYLVDSGVNIDHSEFLNGRVQNLFSFNNDFTDTKGHGTALASIITGNECGITNSTVKSVKIFDLNQATLQSDLLSAFDAIVIDYLNNDTKPSIVNLSWSIAKNSYIEYKIDYLISLGLIVICAAGNSGTPISGVTPASMNNVIKVGAYNQNFEPCNFSNYQGGSIVSVTPGSTNYTETMDDWLFGWSPGEMIYAANKNGGFGYSAGTSQACAITSAILANNLDLYITNDNILGRVYHSSFVNKNNVIKSLYNTALFTRNNILNLSEVYSSCRNLISTFFLDVNVAKINDRLNEITYITTFDQYFKLPLVDGKKFNSITFGDLSAISDELFLDNGFLYGKIKQKTTSEIEQYTLPISFSGPNQETLNTVLTFTAGPSIKRIRDLNANISSLDPELTINLQDDICCSWDGSSCQDLPGENCFQDCNNACGAAAWQAGCYSWATGKFDCFCQCICIPAGEPITVC